MIKELYKRRLHDIEKKWWLNFIIKKLDYEKTR